MKCYCIESGDKFIFCVENVDEKYIENVEGAWFKKDGNKYIKEYPNANAIKNKEIIKNNFKGLGESMFKSDGNWKNSLKIFAEKCMKENIKWYITGSTSEAIIGVEIIPHDIDIVVNVDDFYKIEEKFIEYLIEPFVDNKGTWVVQYFGRICIDGIMFDIVADKNRFEYEWDDTIWERYKVKMEPLCKRYEIEKKRNREERIKRIEEYMEKNNMKCGHCT
jgi:hypothetical protein